MPQLKQIEAAIELGTSNTKLKEYGARYSDGHVETFVAVPDTDMPFSIHISTKGYIAPGISFFVFMDGEYQCNRNKIGLKLPGDGVPPREYETEFRLRQKEEKTSNGSFVAREWSFAKLNTAPSLNRDFVRNVGTIEVVAMRCRPDTDSALQSPRGHPDAVAQKTASRVSLPKLVKWSASEPSKTPYKTASNAAPAEGGLFGGLFDGACDNTGLEGAHNEQSAHLARDEAHYRCRQQQDPYVPGVSGAFPGLSADFEPDGRARAKAFVAEEARKAQNAYLDGPREWHNSYGRYKIGRQQNDLRGDKYLGMNGQDRTDDKQSFRERGDSISQTPLPVIGVEMMDGFICNSRAIAEKINKASGSGKEVERFLAASKHEGYYEDSPAGVKMLESDLEAFRQSLVAMDKNNPRAITADAWQSWGLMEAKLHRMHAARHREAPRKGAASPSPPQREALDDIYELRVELRVAAQMMPDFNLNGWLEELTQTEAKLRKDPLWTTSAYENEVAWLIARRDQLAQRNYLLTRAVETLNKLDSRYNCEKLKERKDQVRTEGMTVNAKLKRLNASPPAGTHPYGLDQADQKSQTNFQQGYDGAPWQRSGKSTTPVQQSFWEAAAERNGGNWHEAGKGSIKPGQQAGYGWDAPMHAPTQDHFQAQDLNQTNDEWGGPTAANDWDVKKPKSNTVCNSQSEGHKAGGGAWGGSQNQQNGNGWEDTQNKNSSWREQIPACKSQGNVEREQRGSNKDDNHHWGGGGGTQQVSQNNGGDGGWGSNDAGGGDGWGAQSNKSQSKSGAWAPGMPAGKANCSRSSARESNRGSSSSNPKDLVKLYWKDWDKRHGTALGSTVNLESRRDVAREAYIYPAAKLPAIPDSKATGATHGVQTGRGAEYNHICRRPVYIDTMEKPYAVFSFKYRSKDKLKQITGLNVKTVDEDAKAMQKQAQKDKLMQIPKDELIEQLMKSSGSKGGSQKAPSAGGAAGWGEKAASNANGWDQKSKIQSAAGSGWGAPANDQWKIGDNQWPASKYSKSKQSIANGRAGGGNEASGWDGPNDIPPEKGLSETGPTPANGGFKFDYDAFRFPDPAAAPSKTTWEREKDSSVFENPDGIRFKGPRVVGYASRAGSEDRRAWPIDGEVEKGASKQQGDGWKGAPGEDDAQW